MTTSNATTTGVVAFFAMILGIYLLYLFVSAVLLYIFRSIGIYRIMEKRNMPNAFLAWIPVANVWAMGSIYDDIKKKENDGNDPKFRILMLIVLIAYCASSGINLSLSINSMSSQLTQNIAQFSFGVPFIIQSMILIAMLVLELICLKKIFEKYAPEKDSYFVLTILFSTIFAWIAPFIPAVCLFKASRNDCVDERATRNRVD